MPLMIIHGDITEQKCDAIVNAANEELQAGGGVCGAIFAKAGHERLQQLCNQIGYCPTGSAVATDGLDLCRYIIHAVGPVWQGGNRDETALLERAYESALSLADELKLESIAFPLISSGIYGYPRDDAFEVAVEVIGHYLNHSDLQVRLVIFDDPSSYFRDKQAVIRHEYEAQLATAEEDYDMPDYLKRKLQVNAPSFSADHSSHTPYTFGLIHGRDREESTPFPSSVLEMITSAPDIQPSEDSFSVALFKLIDAKEMLDTDVYRRANMDRRLFSKIRSDEHYKPSRATAVALVIALKLDLDQANELLEKAGYRIGHSSLFDAVIEHCLTHGIYNIHDVNELLFVHGQKLLGSSN